MLPRAILGLAILHVYIVTKSEARPENYPSQRLNRVKKSVIYDQTNDWDSIKLKGKDLLNEIKKVVHKRWKGVVDHNENAKQVDNVLFSLRCKMNEVKDNVVNFGPIKYIRDMYEEFMYYKEYFKQMQDNENWAG
ncbi:hypothetical protein WDU94_005070 [Cyamophila willieti]